MTNLSTNTPAVVSPLEFIKMPLRGGDAVFSMSRSFWLDAERCGSIQLVRIKKPGRAKGSILLPVAAAREMILRLNKKAGGAT